MADAGVIEDLELWRDHGDAMDAAARRDLLERLKAWQAEHDQGRARFPIPFFQMMWDAVFADEHHHVAEAVREIEVTL